MIQSPPSGRLISPSRAFDEYRPESSAASACRKRLVAVGCLLTTLSGCALRTMEPGDNRVMKCSYYADIFHGRQTANGEIFSQYKLTAAHRYLPFGSRLFVSNPENGNSVVVRINDRGPFINGRDLDLSKRAAAELDFVQEGLALMNVELIEDEFTDTP